LGLYRDRIAPRITHVLCGSGRIHAERAKIVPAAEGVIVEIGIGSGHNLSLYRPGQVKQVIGVEPQPEMLRLGEKAFAGAPVPVELRQGVAEDLPLDDNSADTAVVTFTLCSVAEAEQALAELRRVLKPTGRMLILEHGLSDDAAVARWQNRIDPVWTRLAVGCHINRPMISLVEAAGFAFEHTDTFYLKGAPRTLGWHSRGVAVPR